MFLSIKEGENLVLYYILPLIGLNKKYFGLSLSSTYINKSGEKIFIELKHNIENPIYKTNPNFSTEILFQDKLFLVFNTPPEFLPDVKLFIEGTYSLMSKKAKNLIFRDSGLPYNKTIGKFMVSSPILLALDKSPTLRNYLLTELNVTALTENNELIDKPYSTWFIESKFI